MYLFISHVAIPWGTNLESFGSLRRMVIKQKKYDAQSPRGYLRSYSRRIARLFCGNLAFLFLIVLQSLKAKTKDTDWAIAEFQLVFAITALLDMQKNSNFRHQFCTTYISWYLSSKVRSLLISTKYLPRCCFDKQRSPRNVPQTSIQWFN